MIQQAVDQLDQPGRGDGPHQIRTMSAWQPPVPDPDLSPQIDRLFHFPLLRLDGGLQLFQAGVPFSASLSAVSNSSTWVLNRALFASCFECFSSV